MHVLAGAPQLDEPIDEDSAAALIGQAIAAHALTVLDCAQLTRPVERTALEHATHVAWVIPATTAGLRRGTVLLAVLAKAAHSHEVVIARHDRATSEAALHELAQLADERRAPLVLVPHLDDIADRDTERVIEQAALALQALGGLLHR
jgi:Flp pilus assembly CpaE family ATPase